MKKYIALFVVVILVLTTLTGCADTNYKRGVKYDKFPLDGDFIYEDAIVFSYKDKEDKVELEYGSLDDVDDITEYYQEEFKDGKYIIYEEEVDKDEYNVKGYIDKWEFEIEVEEAFKKLSEFYETVVTIEVNKEVEEEIEDSDVDAKNNDKNDSKQIEKSDEEIFFEGIKELTLRQLENIDNNIFEGVFLSSIYDKLSRSSYNLDFVVDTSGVDSDNESFNLYAKTVIAQNYNNGESSINFSLGENADNTLTNSIYFNDSNTYIKKSDNEQPVYRYTSGRESNYFANTTLGQRLYSTFASKNSSKSSNEEYSPLVDSYINLIRNHIDKSILNRTQSSLILLGNETECNVVNATLKGVDGYNAAYDLFNTMNLDENVQHLFGYIIYEPDNEDYKENTISSIFNVISNLTEEEKEALVLSIDVYEIDSIPINMKFTIKINDKVLDFSILEYVKGVENQKQMNYKAFDGSFHNIEECNIETNQNEYKNSIVISSVDKQSNEESNIQIETTSTDSNDMFSSITSWTSHQSSPEDGQGEINIDLNWDINRATPDNYIGNGTLYMQIDSEDGTNTIDGTIDMKLDFTNDVKVTPITYIEDIGVSVSTYKELYTNILGEEEGLQDDITSRFLSQLGTIFFGLS